MMKLMNILWSWMVLASLFSESFWQWQAASSFTGPSWRSGALSRGNGSQKSLYMAPWSGSPENQKCQHCDSSFGMPYFTNLCWSGLAFLCQKNFIKKKKKNKLFGYTTWKSSEIPVRTLPGLCARYLPASLRWRHLKAHIPGCHEVASYPLAPTSPRNWLRCFALVFFWKFGGRCPCACKPDGSRQVAAAEFKYQYPRQLFQYWRQVLKKGKMTGRKLPGKQVESTNQSIK